MIGDPDILETDDGRLIAYHHTPAQPGSEGAARPGVVFLGGFRSNMTGEKSLALSDWAQKQGRSFLRLDYTGHGASSGAFEDGCIGDWMRDARDAITALTSGPQILVGSSMGGWIALLLARDMPERVAGLLGIAAAPDFTEDGIWPRLTAALRAQMAAQGFIETRSDYDGEVFRITQRLIEDGRSHLVLRAPLRLNIPVRLLHGFDDLDVPFETALRLARHIEGDDVRIVMIKGAGHRLSEPSDLELIVETLEGMN